MKECPNCKFKIEESYEYCPYCNSKTYFGEINIDRFVMPFLIVLIIVLLFIIINLDAFLDMIDV